MAFAVGEKGKKMPRLIDADEAYKVLTDYYHQRTKIQHIALTEALSRVPTVDAEPVRHGYWDTKYSSEDEDWSGIEHTIGRCSVCRGKIDIVGERIPYLYCPFCGAKMDEVD
jgi:hypothetical protein